MQQIVIYFWQMCLLRQGPEQLPTNWFPLVLTITAYSIVAVASLLFGRNSTDPLYIIGSIAIGIAIQTMIVAGILALKRLTYRFAATMSALFGTNTIILLLLFPLTVLLDFSQGEVEAFAEAIFLVSFVWWLTIAGFILHRAANISVLQGIAVALGSEMIVLYTTLTIFPATS